MIEFDPSRFELITSGEHRPRLGTAFATGDDPFDLAFFANAAKGTFHLTGNSLTGVDRRLAPGERQPIAYLTLRGGAKVPAGPSVINLRATHSSTGIPTSLSNSTAASLLLAPAPTNSPKDPVDGVIWVGKPNAPPKRESTVRIGIGPRDTESIPMTQAVWDKPIDSVELLFIRKAPTRKRVVSRS